MLIHAKACNNLTIEKLGSDMAVNIIAQLGEEDKENNATTSPSASHTPNLFASMNPQNHLELSFGTQTPFLSKPVKKNLKAEASVGDKPERWTASVKNQFDTDFMKMLVAMGLSWNFANNPEVWIFHQKWSNGAHIADRRVLSG
jgi:hypothetical protein